MNFETAFKELEKRVQKLEEENLPLEQALKVFEEGVTLIRFCNQALNAAEQRLQELTANAAGEPVLKDIDMAQSLKKQPNPS
ncbi:MAG: exodeoxyribonuclease VII small subunit [Dissulfuribacterales bacterium]